jgi:hypothetical protein
MKRRDFINRSLVLSSGLFLSLETLEKSRLTTVNKFTDTDQIGSFDLIPAPDNPDLWEEWRNSLVSWRAASRTELNYDGASYHDKAFSWVSGNFSCGFIMMCDSEFYDYKTNVYKVKEFISRGEKDFGGYDSVVLWHAYPRIGLDERNQFDFYREMQGGLTGLKDVVSRFHKKNIRVFIDYNPWDTGTRRENISDLDLLIDIIKSIDSDGIFLDTMRNAPGFRQKLDSVREGIVLEGEIALPLEDVETHHMSWAQWFKDSYAPGVYRNKWFERSHMQHAIARWDADRSPQIQTAWMNGSGILVWENIFGQWLGWSERDKCIYRSTKTIQKYFADLFSGENWTPLAVVSPMSGVFISRWEKEGIILWTLINRNETDSEGILFRTQFLPGYKLFNLTEGTEIRYNLKGETAIKGSLKRRGTGCFVAVSPDMIDDSFKELLSGQRENFKSFRSDSSTPVVANRLIYKSTEKKLSSVPQGMTEIPAIVRSFNMTYNFRECGGYMNIQEHIKQSYKNKLHTLYSFTRDAELKRFAIDITPVTNSMFRVFLEKSGYRPAINDNFLRHWKNGQIPEGYEDHPVVYVSPDDARAYTLWAGKRLPTEEEWQFAAEGTEGFKYPWGNTMLENRCNLNTNGKTTPVNAFESGASPFGCLDMCGNTWELTANEYSDGHTRFIMLKGGSCYQAEGSIWYMDGGPHDNSFLAKMLLTFPGLDRCSTVGFRCAADL